MEGVSDRDRGGIKSERCLSDATLSHEVELDADSRKLRGDVESRGPWSCSVPRAARTLLATQPKTFGVESGLIAPHARFQHGTHPY